MEERTSQRTHGQVVDGLRLDRSTDPEVWKVQIPKYLCFACSQFTAQKPATEQKERKISLNNDQIETKTEE